MSREFGKLSAEDIGRLEDRQAKRALNQGGICLGELQAYNHQAIAYSVRNKFKRQHESLVQIGRRRIGSN